MIKLSQEELLFYKDLVLDVKENSLAKKRKVGSIILYDKYVYAGFNFPLTGTTCESELNPYETYEHVVHAEENAIFNMYASNVWKLSLKNRDDGKLIMFNTFTPCYNCCRLIIQAQINVLIYIDSHTKNWDKPSPITGCISPEYLLNTNDIETYQIDELLNIKSV
jgi:dCMP deaminase